MKKELIKKISLVIFIITFLTAVYFLIGKPMLSFVGDHEALEAYINERGIIGWILFVLLIILQTVSTCIPGTPFYLASGYILGGIKGALICDLGATIGNTIAFLLGRKFGKKLLNFLFSKKKMKSVEEYMDDKSPVLIHAMFMLLPLPKDTYAWLGYYSGENVLKWVLITFICRFPHIFVYTFGGAMLLENNYGVIIAGAAFAILVYMIVFLRLKKKHRDSTS